MQLHLFKTLWGNQLPIAAAAQRAVADGLHGLEGPLPQSKSDAQSFIQTLADHNLLYIAEISTTGYANPAPHSTVQQHLDAFERLLAHSLAAHPVLCTTMAGSDLWTFAQNIDFLTRAHAITHRYATRVGFETHRGRSFFHPIITRDLLHQLPPLELTIDFSHWCVVTERLVLDELPDILSMCAERVLHIHGRIGYDQGPQVPDPRAPEYAPYLDAHLRWWRKLWHSQQARGFKTVTITPEFGPDGYLHLAPYTQEPVANLDDLNTWTAHLLRDQFQSTFH